ATPARRVENIVKPITRRFLIGRTRLFLPGNFVKQGYHRKSKRPKRCKHIAKELLPPRSFESRYLSIHRRTRIRGKSFKQHLGRARYSTEPRRRTRVVKHAVKIVVVLLIKTPRRSIPMFGQLSNPAVKQKVNRRLVVKSIASALCF